ncbi:MAG: hypothetical protein HOP15_12905 [Planctomycetes bacterium]|nr:hypothetical protein [Planctomycetota bacterium]
MYSRSSTSSFRRSLGLGAFVFALAWGAVEAAGLPRTGFFGGRALAEKFVRLEAMERAGPVEVLIVGPSYVDQGFDAGRFGAASGTRAFNMGVSGTDMYFQSILLRDMLLLERAPNAVLWALRDEVLTRSNINRQYLASTAVRWATGPVGRWAFTLGQHLPQYHRRRAMDWLRECSPWLRRMTWEAARGDERAALRAWMEPLDEFGRTELAARTRQERVAERDASERNDDDDDDDDGGGAESAAGTTRFMSQDYSIDLATAEAHVRETLRLLRARGIAVWFFFTPYYESVIARHTKHAELVLTGQNEAYFHWLAGLCAESGAPLIDLRYCAEISGEPRYFFDTRHLNAPGAAPLGELLGELYSGKRPALRSRPRAPTGSRCPPPSPRASRRRCTCASADGTTRAGRHRRTRAARRWCWSERSNLANTCSRSTAPPRSTRSNGTSSWSLRRRSDW